MMNWLKEKIRKWLQVERSLSSYDTVERYWNERETVGWLTKDGFISQNE